MLFPILYYRKAGCQVATITRAFADKQKRILGKYQKGFGKYRLRKAEDKNDRNGVNKMGKLNWIRTQEELERWIEQYPKVILFGERGLATIMIRHYSQKGMSDRIAGISYEKTLSEYKTFLDKTVKPMEDYEPDSCLALLVLGRPDGQQERLEERVRNWNPAQIFYADYYLMAELSRRDHVKMDFLCVGFTKCGTTSLQQALKKNKKIYLPKEKEILYGKWKNDYLDAPERFREQYFSGDLSKRKCGCIEPTYFRRANFVFESFGAGTKIIFMMRNPADATYSYFKMMMRRSYEPKQREYYRKYGKYSPEMFQDYMEDYIFSRKEQRFCYDIWLKEYLQFYKKEDIMVILFEEIIKEPERILNELQRFLGLKPKKLESLPYSNPGKQVSRNYLSARINAKLHLLKVKEKEGASRRRKEWSARMRQWIQKYTLVDNSEKISASDREKLMSFYQPSIREVERLTGRSMKGFWY